jgi:hypothetical protein
LQIISCDRSSHRIGQASFIETSPEKQGLYSIIYFLFLTKATMKKTNIILLVFATALFGFGFTFVISTTQKNDPQKTVQAFIPDIIAQFPNVRDLAIAPTENEMYFTIQGYQGELSSIAVYKNYSLKNTKPEIAPFSGTFDDLEPAFSNDGLRLYFSSNRPTDKQSKTPKDYDIWYVERKNLQSDWSEPINMGTPVNTLQNEFYPSVAASGNIYFTCDGELSKGKDDIFVCLFKNGKYETPISLSDSINAEGYEFNAFIAPDESYLIFSGYSRKDGFGSGDLYLSYRMANGQWSKAKNLGKEINSTQMDYCPFIKSGILYFTSKRVSTSTLAKRNIEDWTKEANRYENGLSRLYMVPVNKFMLK